MNVEKAIRQYYELKQQYNEQINEMKGRIRSRKDLSATEKRQKYAQTEKKCVNCNKSGGTIFKQENFILRAMCGHTTDPCNLNIQIYKGEYKLSNELSYMKNEELIKTQQEIIKAKLDMMFEYIDEETLLNTFNDMKKDLVEYKEMYDFYQHRYLNTVFNKEKLDTIQKNKLTLDAKIKKLRNKMTLYEEEYDNANEQNSELIKECIELYNTHILPLIETNNKLLYEYNRIETCYDQLCEEEYNVDMFFLIQKKYSIQQLEEEVGDQDARVISFET